ncbi:MAG: hypothetical protein JXR07_14950 [Reichenbachiella sp.]
MKIERFIIKVMIAVGLIAASFTTILEIIRLDRIDSSAVIGLTAVGTLVISLILIQFDKVKIAGILTTSVLLILMSLDIVFSEFLRHSSLATLIILAFSNSAAFLKSTRIIMHSLTFLTLSLLLFFLYSNGYELPDGSSFITISINLLATYLLLGYITYSLKNQYDLGMNKLQNTLESLKSTEAQLVQSEKMAALGTLSAGIGHELNNPLNFLQNGLFLLKNILRDHKNVKVKSDPIMAILDEGVRRSVSTVKSLFEFSSPPNYEFSQVSTKKILDNCIMLITHQLNTGVEISMEFEDENYKIIGDQGALHQLFINVLVNSIESIQSTGKIFIKQSVDSTFESIIIKDTGSGISEKNLQKVMEPFFTTKDPGKGTGLGLSVSYAVIKKHGGSINIESQIGKGTTVIIQLPHK